MFGKRKNLNVFAMNRRGLNMFMDRVSFDYIQDLEKKVEDLEVKNKKLRDELNTIKPVLDTGKLVPALSVYCKECVFAAKSRYNGQVIGCMRGNVCESFRPEDQ